MSSFKSCVCPVCGHPAAAQCPQCGLKAQAFDGALHAGVGLLAIAYVALGAGGDATAHMAFMRFVGETKQWLMHQIGSLAQWARENRPKAPGPAKASAIEEKIHQFGRDALLALPLDKITPELLDTSLRGFEQLCAPAIAAGWKPQPKPVLAKTHVSDGTSPAERALLSELQDRGLADVVSLRTALAKPEAVPEAQTKLLAALDQVGVRTPDDLLRFALARAVSQPPTDKSEGGS